MSKSVDFYLSKVFSPKMAEYFASGRKTIVSVTANKDFTLTLAFDNNEIRIFDMKPYLKENTVFKQFLNFEDFKRVYIDDSNNVCWDKNPEIDSEIEWNNKHSGHKISKKPCIAFDTRLGNY